MRGFGLAAAFAATAMIWGMPASAEDAPQGDPANGKRLVAADGCYQCHGYVGQGARGPGPRLNPELPFEAFLGQLRKPAAEMPVYTPLVISDKEVADIYAYLKSVPRPTDIKNIPTFSK